MKVTARNLQPEALDRMYKAALQMEDGKIEEKEAVEMPSYGDADQYIGFPESLFEKTSEKSEGGFKMKSSTPDDSVGQLASMLARAETRIDVQQVSSKAIRALTSLKMGSVASEGKEKEKIARLIRRMEKLIKRINKKLQHLSREEQLEGRRKQAEKKKNELKEAELRKELQRKRTKRRRDERNYASKELAQDQKDSSQELMDSLQGLGAPAGATLPAGVDGSLPADLDVSFSAGYTAEAPVVEGASVDMSV